MLTPFRIGWMCKESNVDGFLYNMRGTFYDHPFAADLNHGFYLGTEAYTQMNDPLPSCKATPILVADHETLLSLPEEQVNKLFSTLREAYKPKIRLLIHQPCNHRWVVHLTLKLTEENCDRIEIESKRLQANGYKTRTKILP